MSAHKEDVDVLCVGHAAFDLVFSVPHHPAPDEKSVATSLVGCGGGPAANAAVAVSRLGFSAAFAGYLGNDHYGQTHCDELVRENVNLELVVRGSSPTPLSAILVKPDGRRTVVNYRGNTQPLAPEEVDFSKIKPRVVLFDGLEHLISPPIAKVARQRGITTILDAGSLHQGTQALAGRIDHLVCAEKFARQFSGEKDEALALTLLSEYAQTVVITLGERGLIWKNGARMGRLPAFKVKAVDTTGAGDAFHAAYAVCIAENKPWEATLRFASAAAALCCTRLGARPGLPTGAEVRHFLQGQSNPDHS